MSDEFISLLYSGADAVLANSGHEPFGLVGLEVMAAGGVAFVGSTGEDYAVPSLNSVVLDSDDPAEINIALAFLRTHHEFVQRLRDDAQETARSFTWQNVIANNLLGKLEYVGLRQLVDPPQQSPSEPAPQASPPEDPPPAGAAEAAGKPGDQKAAQSLGYGGKAVSQRLSVKPKLERSDSRRKPPPRPVD